MLHCINNAYAKAFTDTIFILKQEEDWRPRESAILALGAISEGCANGLLGHLSEMVNVLLPKLLDSRPLVRSITCWALSRYSHWIVQAGAEQPNGPGQQQFDTVIAVRPHAVGTYRVMRGLCGAPTFME